MREKLKCFQVFKRTLSKTGEQMQGLNDAGFLESSCMRNTKAAAKNIKMAINLMVLKKYPAALIIMQNGQSYPMQS